MALLLTTALLPLVLGALLPLLKFKSKKQLHLYVQAATSLTAVMAFYVVFTHPEGTFTLFTMTDAFTLTIRVDGLSRIFMSLISFLWPMATLYAFEYMGHEGKEQGFFAYYTMTYGVTLFIAMSANLFTMYVFYELLTICTLPLVTHKMEAHRVHAGRKYVYYSISGAALGFVALMCVAYFAGTTDFTLGGLLTAENTAGVGVWVPWLYLIAFIGYGTKAAVFPMFDWLPAASVAPTPVTALLHSVAVVKSGAFAVIRITYYVFGTALLYGTWAQNVAIGLAAFTIVLASVLAVREQHFKRRLAYSTVSNLSYILFSAALMTPAGMVGAMTHLLFQGMMKIVSFYCAGAVLIKTGRQYVQELRGIGRYMPVTMACYTISALGLVGVPPLLGFVSKWNIITAATATGLPMATVGIAALIVSAILSIVYLFQPVVTAYFLPLDGELPEKSDPTWRMKTALIVLSAVSILSFTFTTPLTAWLTRVAQGLM